MFANPSLSIVKCLGLRLQSQFGPLKSRGTKYGNFGPYLFYTFSLCEQTQPSKKTFHRKMQIDCNSESIKAFCMGRLNWFRCLAKTTGWHHTECSISVSAKISAFSKFNFSVTSWPILKFENILELDLSGMKIPKHFTGKYYIAKWLGNPSQNISWFMSKKNVVQNDIKVRFFWNRLHSHSKIVLKKIKIDAEMTELWPLKKWQVLPKA